MEFSIHILGSGSALPSYERFQSSQIISKHNEPYLIDCGESTQIQIRRFGIKSGKLKNIFISHLHGDHYFGLFGLLSSFSLNGRREELNIYADENLKKILFSDSSPIRIDELDFKINFFSIPDGHNLIFSDEKITIESFPLKHSIRTFGFLFKEKQLPFNVKKEKIAEFNLSIEQIKNIKKGEDIIINGQLIKNSELSILPSKPRSYAYCSDTGYSEDFIEIIKNVDILYHEATYLENDIEKTERYQHSTAKNAATIAKLANAKILIIGHFSSRYINYYPFELEAKTIFQNTILAFDGLHLELPIEKK